MSTHRWIDRICAIAMAAAIVLTVLFMNGTRFGITLAVDADAEGHSDDSWFTENDLNAGWDTSGATVIRLGASKAEASSSDTGDIEIQGSGCYLYNGNVVIAQAGKYVVSGELSGGSIVVDAEDTAKVWILFDGVTIEREDDACLIVDQADKVFLTLAEGSVNTLTSGDAYSDEALSDNTDGAIFAHDDLTINGSGTLKVTAGCKHGIAANDDLVITGGTISISAPKDAIHANDSLRITKAVLDLSAEDDGMAVDNEGAYIYMESGDISIQCADEGMTAPGDITIAGGSISITTGTEQGHHGIKAGGTCTVTDGSIRIDSCYEGIQALYIDVQGGDLAIYPADDGINASTGDSSEEMFGMQGAPMGGMQGAMQGDTEGVIHGGPAGIMQGGPAGGMQGNPADVMQDETEGSMEGTSEEDSQWSEAIQAQGVPVQEQQSDSSENESGDTEEAEKQSDSTGQNDMQQPGHTTGMPFIPDTGNATGTDTGNDTGTDTGNTTGTETGEGTADTEASPWIHISGGTILIENETGMDSDGIDSNGDILISGGDIRISLNDSGMNNAFDFGSENGGTLTITGGTVIACGSSGMLEGVSTESAQASVTYVTETSQGEETDISLQEEAGASLLSWTVPYSFSAILISCPEMKTGENYVLSIGDTTETISLSDIVTTAGAESGSSGAMPGGAMPGGAMPGGAMPGGAMPGGAMPGGAMPEQCQREQWRMEQLRAAQCRMERQWRRVRRRLEIWNQ